MCRGHGAGGASAAGARGGGVRRRARRRRRGCWRGCLAGWPTTVAVLLSRVGFSSGGHERRPLRKTQAEEHTRRAPPHVAGIHPEALPPRQRDLAIRLERQPARHPTPRGRGCGVRQWPPSRRSAPAATSGWCRGCCRGARRPQMPSTRRPPATASLRRAGGANGSNGLVARIHHYMTRSVDEALKVADIACRHTATACCHTEWGGRSGAPTTARTARA